MTDKVQKIREEVERLKGWNNNVRNSTRHMTLQEEDFNRGKHSSYLEILDFIDSLQEESVSGNINFEQELYKAFGQVKDFTLGMQIAKWFYDMGKNSKDSQEPVSEDLEEAAQQWYDSAKFKSDLSGTPIGAFKAGASWQKEQFEKNRLKHCDSITKEQAELEQGFIDQHLDKHNRIPTFLDAIEYGMNLQKEQIMENATEAIVAVDAGGYPYIPQIELYDYDKDVPLAKERDKYKVILIKEDRI